MAVSVALGTVVAQTTSHFCSEYSSQTLVPSCDGLSDWLGVLLWASALAKLRTSESVKVTKLSLAWW